MNLAFTPEVMTTILLAISTGSAVAGAVYLILSLGWRAKAYFFSREGDYFVLRAVKTLFKIPKMVKFENGEYLLTEPTYVKGERKFYYFEIGKAEPIGFVRPKSIRAEDLRLLVRDQVIKQAFSGLRTSGGELWMWLIGGIAIGAVVVFLLGGMGLIHLGPAQAVPPTNTTTTTTIAPRPAP